jgi:hypothetical protein
MTASSSPVTKILQARVSFFRMTAANLFGLDIPGRLPADSSGHFARVSGALLAHSSSALATGVAPPQNKLPKPFVINSTREAAQNPVRAASKLGTASVSPAPSGSQSEIVRTAVDGTPHRRFLAGPPTSRNLATSAAKSSTRLHAPPPAQPLKQPVAHLPNRPSRHLLSVSKGELKSILVFGQLSGSSGTQALDVARAAKPPSTTSQQVHPALAAKNLSRPSASSVSSSVHPTSKLLTGTTTRDPNVAEGSKSVVQQR